jgi:hydroxylamine reductase (hybrid-cluster protein)
MLIALKTFWAYVKKYWHYFVLIIFAVISYFFLRRKNFDFAKQLEKIQDLHEEEVRKILVAKEEERILRIQNEEKLKIALESVTQQYEKSKKELDEKKKKEIEDIVKRYQNNPEALAKKLSETAGFTIILPRD